MIFQFFRRTRDDPSIAPLYGTIVAQARAEALYQRFGVPDTVNGRLEMVLLHVVLLLRRLNAEPDGAPRGYAQSYEKGRGSSQASGTLTAPFSGIHGWFWENTGDQEITVTLTTAGFYSMSHEFRRGAPVKNKIFP